MSESTFTPRTSISKSGFMVGEQCLLKLWLRTYEPKKSEKRSSETQKTLDVGHEVGDLACRMYPEGVMIEHDHHHFEEALEETERLMESQEVSALFEPAFQYQGVICRVDILERLSTGDWRMIEVKSTASAKDAHIRDAALQFWILRNLGLLPKEWIAVQKDISKPPK